MPIIVSNSVDSPTPTSTQKKAISKSAQARALRLPFAAKVGGLDRLFFTEQLALLLETGMPLVQSLTLLAGQTENPAMKRVVEDLTEQVTTGKSLSAALSEHPDVYSSTYVNLVAASEGGGFLHEVLAQLLHMEERRESLRSTVISALTYPAFLTVFSVFTVMFVLVFVFPKFGDMFAAISDELPVTTVWLLAASNFIIERWQWLLIGMVFAGYLVARWFKSNAGKQQTDRWKLGLPIVRGLSIQLYLAQSLRVLGLSVKHGVPIVEALQACRDSVGNWQFRRLLERVEANVREGGRISEEFDASSFVPTLAKQMLRTAEEAGNLAIVGERLADYYEREMAKRLDRVSKLVEPIMLLVMGGVVGLIVSSLVLPIFKLSHAVS